MLFTHSIVLLRVSFEALAYYFALLSSVSELIYLALISPVLASGCLQTAAITHVYRFVPVVVLSCQRADGSVHPFAVGRFCYLHLTGS